MSEITPAERIDLPEGWYEANHCDETNWLMGDENRVTHWMPLPALPTEVPNV